MTPLQGATLDNLFTARVSVPCEQLTTPTTLYWAVEGKELLSANIPAQHCIPSARPTPALPPIQVVVKDRQCLVNTGGNTLWRTASELAQHNGATVYQNIYALLIHNRAVFEEGDVHRLRGRYLRCPTPELLSRIAPDHARRLFAETLVFSPHIQQHTRAYLMGEAVVAQ